MHQESFAAWLLCLQIARFGMGSLPLQKSRFATTLVWGAGSSSCILQGLRQWHTVFGMTEAAGCGSIDAPRHLNKGLTVQESFQAAQHFTAPSRWTLGHARANMHLSQGTADPPTAQLLSWPVGSKSEEASPRVWRVKTTTELSIQGGIAMHQCSAGIAPAYRFKLQGFREGVPPS